MGKEFILLVVIILCFAVVIVLGGCSSYDNLLKKVPDAEFESFTYHRGGNVTSATVTALGAKLTDDTMKIDSVHITADYGPFVNFAIELKGYKREIAVPDPSRQPGLTN